MTDKFDPVYVTRPSMPPLEEYIPYLQQIYETGILANNGPFHMQLEERLAEYLGVKHISLFANGTLALMVALQALDISGEVITTPFSFVATTHAITWNNLTPVFADVEPDYFTLDPEEVEKAISPETTAILPVHVYGNPCREKELKNIADRHGLRIIYDAAHAFGVRVNDNSIANFGDMSVLSFHATKVFNTFEGGAIVCHDAATKRRVDDLKNFGFRGETDVVSMGINGKMNELQAAMGLLQLNYIDANIEKRRVIAERYRELLGQTDGLRLLQDVPGVRHCYSYFPLLIEGKDSGADRDIVYKRLKENNIFTRRYFYPLISQFPPYRGLASAAPGNMPVAEMATGRVICLPIYPDLSLEMVGVISNIVRESL